MYRDIIKRRVRGHLVRQGVPVAIAEQEADRYSGHSFRHGFTATAAEAGANLPAIKASPATGAMRSSAAI